MDELTFAGFSAEEFEKFCRDLLERLGFQRINWRKGTARGVQAADGGRDIEAAYPRMDPGGDHYLESWFIECKHHAKAISATHLTNLLKTAEAHRPEVVLFIVSECLTNHAKNYLEEYARQNRPAFRIKYWEGHDLRALMERSQGIGQGMGIQATPEIRFIDALSRLNHENTNVRAGALSLLESVGEATAEWRQRVIDRVCHYLRNGHNGHVDDETRKVAQKILTDHLSAFGEGSHWANIDLNLSGTHLIDLDLSSAKIWSAAFTGCHFAGTTRFDGMRFRSDVTFDSAIFEHGAGFSKANFEGPASFKNCRFGERATFSGAKFRSIADFSKAEFCSTAGFSSVAFSDMAVFAHVIFENDALFPNVSVHDDAIFMGARFETEACFELARFSARVDFSDVHVGIGMDFSAELTQAYSHTLPPGFRLFRKGSKVYVIDEQGLADQ